VEVRHQRSTPDTLLHIPALHGSTGEEDITFFHVLWIERKGDVAYRRALGQVGKEAWKRECVGEIEIILG
jgi:hypothetical protein